jgi:drug/metabolite transporter (DMT)-like permease
VDFTRLLWASLLGFIIFNEIPDVWTWIGGAVIFAAVTYVALQERGRRADAPASTLAGG